MNDHQLRTRALWLAIEDYAGLWELVWEFNSIRPGSAHNENKTAARQILGELVEHGFVELFYCKEPYGVMTPVEEEDVALVLDTPTNWLPHADAGTTTVRFSATPTGEKEGGVHRVDV